MGRQRWPAELSHFTGEKTEVLGNMGAPRGPFRAGGTEPAGSRPGPTAAPRPGLHLLPPGGAMLQY